MRCTGKLRSYRMSLWKRKSLVLFVCAASILITCSSSFAEPVDSSWHGFWNIFDNNTPHETAFSIYGGTSYDWAHTYFQMVSFQRILQYDSIVPHKSPEGLKVRFEAD